MTRALLAAAFALLIASCHSEERRYQELAPTRERAPLEENRSFTPGPPSASALSHSAPFETTQTNPYESNVWGISEGQRYYRWFNCSGCHANGGGGMGPPLMDGKWRYGSDARSIFSSILNGRPNGMPAFRGRVNEQQAWQLVAYVRALGGLVPRPAAPSRSDSMQATDAPSIAARQKPYPEQPGKRP
jgi:cytochrome c oxidase cbb3-type subunit III